MSTQRVVSVIVAIGWAIGWYIAEGSATALVGFVIVFLAVSLLFIWYPQSLSDFEGIGSIRTPPRVIAVLGWLMLVLAPAGMLWLFHFS